MAALTSGSWTITFRNDISQDIERGKRKKRIDLKLALPTTGTLPTSLVLPGAGSVGLTRNLDRYDFNYETIASGDYGAAGPLIYRYGVTGNTIKFFRGQLMSNTGQSLIPLLTSASLTPTTKLAFYVTAIGW